MKMKTTLSRIVVIGGSGHVGSYLLPRLVEGGHKVINVSRGVASPYVENSAWKDIEQVLIDREAEEHNGHFGSHIADLKPDIVIDMIAFRLDQVKHLVDALQGKLEHYIFCSSIWAQGPLTSIPSTEDDPTNAIDTYGSNKAEIEAWLLQQARDSRFPATCFRPGHIVGKGWLPINPQCHFNPNVFAAIACGEDLALPNFGLEMLHHVHADDVAQWIVCAITHRTASIGEVFNTVSAQALTLRGYAEAMYQWFGREPRLSFAPYEEWKLRLEHKDAETAWGHVMRSSCVSIEKSRRLLRYSPKFSSLEAVQESVTAAIASGKINVPKPTG